MLTDLLHRITDGLIRVEKVGMLAGVPFAERRKLLRDGAKETNDNTNRRGLHVVAEFLDNRGILMPVSHASVAGREKLTGTRKRQSNCIASQTVSRIEASMKMVGQCFSLSRV
jgi:hypothetical protein